MAPMVLAFAGQIKSGKTTVSRAVAERLSCGRACFGDYVRAEAKKRGLSPTRENLQAVGEQLVAEHLGQFCAGVLAAVDCLEGSHVVIDGIRHVEAAERLKELVAPKRLYLVYVDTDDAVRERRHLTSSPADKPLNLYEQHSTEKQVDSQLRSRADLVVNGSSDLSRTVHQILTFVGFEANEL